MAEKKRTCLTDKEKLRIIENSRQPAEKIVEKSNPSIVDYPSLVDNFALMKISTIEGFQCIAKVILSLVKKDVSNFSLNHENRIII